MDPNLKRLTTYARRKSRASDTQRCNVKTPSSPLENLPASKADLTVEEMSARMKKRSRQATANHLQHGNDYDSNDRGGPGRSAKRLKHFGRADTGPSTETAETEPAADISGDLPATPFLNGTRAMLPLATQRIHDSIFETPYPSDQTTLQSYLVSMEDGPLSPVPLGRRILSRTSSRTFKENKSYSRSLASPFHSRPASRSPSPLKSQDPKRPALYSKSRTLSSSFLRQNKKTSGVDQNSTYSINDSLFDSTHSAYTNISQTVNDKTATAYSHARTTSIPNVSSHLLGEIAPEDWLVPPKALRRSPPSHDDMELDVFQADCPSFYSDMPNEVSTPSRKRQTTITYKNARLAEAAKSTTDDIWSDDDMQITRVNPQESPRQPRRRRRTVVHMSSDSIFSSALDFSAYMTDNSPAQTHNEIRTSPSSIPPGVFESSEPAAPVLDPAFSPAPLFSGHTSGQSTVQDRLLIVPPTPGANRPVLSRSPRSLPNIPTIDDELHGMFSKLALHGEFQSFIVSMTSLFRF